MKPTTPATAAEGERGSRPSISWLVLGCSLLVTVLAWDVSSRSVKARLREQFVRQTEQTAQRIAHRMREYEVVLRSGVALFAASNDVTRSDFARFYKQLDLAHDYPGFQSIAFTQYVPRAALDALTAGVKAEGFPDFQVFPAGDRAFYTPLLYVEPLNARTRRALGYDMSSEPVRRAAMERAWRTGAPSTSGIVRLVADMSEHPHRKAFLMYLPVYRGSARTEQERLASLLGYVCSPFRVEALMHGVFGAGPADLSLAIFDGSSDEPFFDTRRTDGAGADAEFVRERALVIGGRTWRIMFWTRPSFGAGISRDEPLRLLGAGLVINLLLLLVLRSDASLRRRAQALAEQMTEALKQSHEREQARMRDAIREKETLLKEIQHRVKNNLQVVSSLLSLQRNHIVDPAALAPLRDSQYRVLTMAALHDFLYQAEDLSCVDTRAYLTHVISMLAEAYRAQGRVGIELTLAEVQLDADRAILCGLITNEAVGHAFQHIFSERSGGRLRVSLQPSDGQLVLDVQADDPARTGPAGDAPDSLGLQLVELLAAQLAGEVHLDQAQGTRCTVTFPLSTQARA